MGSPPLLDTKLYIPRGGTGLVSRPRLIERISRGAQRKVTLISAPPGFGKTTLLGEWLAGRDPTSSGEGYTELRDQRAPLAGGAGAGWVSLDTSDNEPALFWAYFLEAMRRANPALGNDSLALLRAPQRAPIESVLTALINELNALDSEIVLILDDYHVIEAPAIHGAMTFLLDHLPPGLHIVLASRSDPPLPLSRLRARGDLAELRPADLRFTEDEASAFLNRVMSLDLSASDTAELGRRTEGWIAGLKLAALSLTGGEDVHRFVEAFSGDNRHIADYLVDEVLRAQPEHVRRFLLDTSILERMSARSCDVVTGETGSQALLEGLERQNVFVVPLDDRREWYRYHHLFADVLQAHARREDPDRFHAAHRRASAWYEEGGSLADAVRHALAAVDLERAAGLLELQWTPMDRSYQARRWLARVKALPEAVVRARPVLSMGYAWGLLNSGELEAAEARLKDVERWLSTSSDREDGGADPSTAATKSPGGEQPAAEKVVVDEARFRSLSVELASARVYLAQTLGEVPDTVEYAKRSLDIIPESDHEARATGTALLALALWARGDLDPAYRTFAEALALMRKSGAIMGVIRGTFVLGDIRVAQGLLHEAASIYERGLRLAAEQAQPAVAETDELYLGLSEVHREWGDLGAAERYLLTMSEAAGRAEHVGNRQRWCTAMARVREAHGDLDAALALLEEAEGIDIRGPLPRLRPITAMKVRVWVGQGRLGEAVNWVGERGLTIDDDLNFAREYEHITLARVLIARHHTDGGQRALEAAMRLLGRLTTAAAAGGRTGAVIETLVLQALARQASGGGADAFEPLERALTLADAEGYLRTFIDEGHPMRELLRLGSARGIASDYTRRVLSAFDEPAQASAGSHALPDTEASQLLTARELVILRLIASGLRNQEIAKQLFISPATVKRHVANIYNKLGVGHRTEALVRAGSLNLL